jgi:HEPN domain-containing protein
MKEETRKWMEKAAKDLDDGIFNFENERTGVAVFLFHQAAEKSLKALQIEKSGSHDFSHDLLALSGEKSQAEFKELFMELNLSIRGLDILM